MDLPILVRDEFNPVIHTTKTGIDYFKYDLLYVDTSDSNTVKPAGSFTWDTNLATTQPEFKAVFAGVALYRILAAQAGRKIEVGTCGVYRYPCAALGSALRAGIYIGPDKAAGNALLPQQVVNVATKSLAIGQLAEDAKVGATDVMVRIVSTVQTSGVQGVV